MVHLINSCNELVTEHFLRAMLWVHVYDMLWRNNWKHNCNNKITTVLSYLSYYLFMNAWEKKPGDMYLCTKLWSDFIQSAFSHVRWIYHSKLFALLNGAGQYLYNLTYDTAYFSYHNFAKLGQVLLANISMLLRSSLGTLLIICQSQITAIQYILSL